MEKALKPAGRKTTKAAKERKTVKAAKEPKAVKAAPKKASRSKEPAQGAGYDRFKEYNGKQYTGMQVGRSHHWQYDAGDWKETKITPDLWEISYAVTKRRKGHAPENSGVKVGTAYQWYIMAYQKVKKLNADDYSTEMAGLKFKLAHKRADNPKWNIKAGTQRKHLIAFLKDMIAHLESEPVTLEFEFNNVLYKGEALPVPETCTEGGLCREFEIVLNDENYGIIKSMKSGWKMDRMDKKMIKMIGAQIAAHYGTV